MTIMWSSRLVGTFLGYKGGFRYVLSDGSRWLQDDQTDEPVYREDPGARLLTDDTGRIFLDVEGTSAIVEVMKAI